MRADLWGSQAPGLNRQGKACTKWSTAVSPRSGIMKPQPTAGLFVISETSLNWAFFLSKVRLQAPIGGFHCEEVCLIPRRKGRFPLSSHSPCPVTDIPLLFTCPSRGEETTRSSECKKDLRFDHVLYPGLKEQISQVPTLKSLAQQRYKNINYRRRL